MMTAGILFPLALSLSKGAFRREAWFDRLTTNGVSS
jgi:hypothetical protein